MKKQAKKQFMRMNKETLIKLIGNLNDQFLFNRKIYDDCARDVSIWWVLAPMLIMFAFGFLSAKGL